MKNCIVVIICAMVMQIPASCNNTTNSAKAVAVGDSAGADSLRHIEILDNEALNIIDSNAAIEIIAGGFTWTEGPLYFPDQKFLLFSDIPNNKVYKWSEGGAVVTYLEPSGFTGKVYKGKEPGSNALLLSPQHEFVLLQHGDRRIAKMDAELSVPRASFTTLASGYNGKRFNSPNDGVYAKDGSLYFTDPPYGLANRLEDSTKELPFQGVFVLRTNGKVELLTDEIKFPNGITLSPDEKFLYVSNSDPDNKIWMKYELDEKGLIKSKTQFYSAAKDNGIDNGNPDGLKMNKAGYLFASGPKGIWIFSPPGKVIARIYTGQPTSNCALANNEKDLFITCAAFVMRVKLK